MKGSRDTCCMNSEQVDDWLTMVAELKEEVERIKSIKA